MVLCVACSNHCAVKGRGGIAVTVTDYCLDDLF